MAPAAPTVGAAAEDDDALNALLDDLPGGSLPGGSLPGAPSTALLGDTFLPAEIPAGILAANAGLPAGDPGIPALARDAGNAPVVLAAALTAAVRLGRSAAANRILHADADAARAAAVQREVDAARHAAHLSRQLRKGAEAAKDAERRIRELERRVAAAERATAAAKEGAMNDRKRAAARDSAHAAAAKKRERELGRLRARVHTALGAGGKIGLEPSARVAAGSRRARKVDGGGPGAAFASFAAGAGRAAENALSTENGDLRAALSAVHGEIDALVQAPAVIRFEERQARILYGEGAKVEMPPKAPGKRRMSLPYAVVQADVEDALVDKLKILRRVLLAMGGEGSVPGTPTARATVVDEYENEDYVEEEYEEEMEGRMEERERVLDERLAGNGLGNQVGTQEEEVGYPSKKMLQAEDAPEMPETEKVYTPKKKELPTEPARDGQPDEQPEVELAYAAKTQSTVAATPRMMRAEAVLAQQEREFEESYADMSSPPTNSPDHETEDEPESTYASPVFVPTPIMLAAEEEIALSQKTLSMPFDLPAGVVEEIVEEELEDEFVEEELVGEEVDDGYEEESPASSPETDKGKKMKRIDSLLDAGDDPSDDGGFEEEEDDVESARRLQKRRASDMAAEMMKGAAAAAHVRVGVD